MPYKRKMTILKNSHFAVKSKDLGFYYRIAKPLYI